MARPGMLCFNPRARDGRERQAQRGSRQMKRFNPRARDGREAMVPQIAPIADVSIHAPVMDAKSCYQ